MIKRPNLMVVIASIGLGLVACDAVCVGPVDCPAHVNVTYEHCDGGEHTFSDGAVVSSAQEATDYCSCASPSCLDGSSAKLCTELYKDPDDTSLSSMESCEDDLSDYYGEYTVTLGLELCAIEAGLTRCLGLRDCSANYDPEADGTRV
ncbi:MAG: hypothetical protein ACJAYU_002098 [Bradymonadia bacterium]|jgi:hypothetical protein